MEYDIAIAHIRMLGFIQACNHPNIYIRPNDRARLMYSTRYNNQWICTYLPESNAKELRILMEQLNER